MSSSMSSELLATYAGLGTHDGDHYYKGEECLACVKDLIRALRGDDSRCEIRRQLGLARVLQKDLLSILVSSSDDNTLRNDIIRLLVNLTQPAYLCFSGSLPKRKDSDAMRCYMEVEKYLRRYKEAFTVETVLNVLGSVLADLCQKDWDHRDDDDIIIIERILLLIRNILHVSPDPQEEKRTEDDVSVHDQIIWNLHINGIDELLLFLGSNSEETQWCMHVLEIFFLMLREQSASVLAGTGKGRTAEEKKRDEDLIDEALAKERERKAKAMKMRSSRHSRFGGTFVVKNQKSISGSARVYHRPIAGLKDHSYDVEKRPRRTNKNKRPAGDLPGDRLSTYSIRLVLKNVCIQFLECCYNPLMKVVRDNIRRSRAMENDDTYYLWALRFFMEFCRCHDFRVDIVGETLQLSTFHYLIQLTATYYESMVLEKRDIPMARQWAQRLHYAVQGYYEMLQYIHQMSITKDESLQESSKVMLSNLVYHQEYRDVFISLLRNYNEVMQIVAMARIRAHLIDANHPEAVALLRAARVVWPDEGFGREGISVDEEMETMKAILFNPAAAIPAARLMTNIEDGEEEEEEEGEEEVGGGEVVSYETQFEIRKYIQRFSNNKIIRAYCLVLANYRNNSSSLNHAVVKMLYRIAVELKMAPLLFQVSIFRIMLAILEEPISSRFRELQKFCRYVVAGFFHMSAKNPLVFVELLLWKTSQDVYELTEGYGALEREREKKQLSTVWTREQDEELAELFYRYKNEDDVVACIMAGLPDDIPRSRKQVAKQLVSRELVGSSKELTKKAPKKKTGEWTEEEETLLREVFQTQVEEGGGEEEEREDVVKRVASYFPERGVRNVASKMKEFGMLSKRRAKERSTATAEPVSPSSTAKPRQRGGVRDSSKKKKTKSGRKRAPETRSMARLVMSLSCRGYEEQLAWLEAYLRDEARDRTMDDEWEEMCIVPVGEAVSRVFQELEFQDLLSSLHLQPPSDTEVYWRIPAAMPPGELSRAADSLKPSAILDDEEQDREQEVEDESEQEVEEDESEQEVEEDESEQEVEEEVEEDMESEQEVDRVNEDEESEEVEMEEGKGKAGGECNGKERERQGRKEDESSENESSSDVELVIDYGEEESQSKALVGLLSRRRGKSGSERQSRLQRRSHVDEAEKPQAKKPRLSHANFLDSDSEDEQQAKTTKPSPEPAGSSSETVALINPRKLALDSDSESERSGGDSEDDSEGDSSGDNEEKLENSVCSDSVSDTVDQTGAVDHIMDQVDHDQKTPIVAVNDLHSPVMDTVDLMGTVDHIDSVDHKNTVDSTNTVETVLTDTFNMQIEASANSS